MSRETTISFVKGEEMYYYSNIISEMKHMEKLIGKEGVILNFDCRERDDEGGISLKMPVKYYKKPTAPRKMTDESKEKASERFKKMWEDKRELSENEE